MTKIIIDEELNFDKTHFKNIEEFIDYLRSNNLIYELQPTNLVNEDTVSYSNQTESMIDDDFELPQWQKDVIDKRLEDIKTGKTKFQDFDSALREIEKEL